MNFDKAFKELLSGKKIRRKEWEKLRYLQIKDNRVVAFQGEYTHFHDDSNVLMSDGWIVVDGDGARMTFIEALDALRKKQCITCERMGDSFIFIDNDQLTLCKPVEFSFIPTWKCMNSDDWQIIK